ncbi:hypothetical protein GY632_5941 [Trichophyton interdigitale]|nr:hypothetical protein GY632_5941 [Trichophyton interdigitale]
MLALARSNFNEYVQQSIYRIDRDIDVGRLKRAWDQAVASNPILRTRIVSLPNYGIVQAVLDEEVQWMFESTLDQFRKRATPKELPMGLGDPLIRFGIISEKSEDTHYFTWEMHHALYDGWSIPLILSDVEHAYYQEPGPELLAMNPYIKYIQNIDEIAAHRFWTDQFVGIQGTGFPWIGLSTYVDPNPDVLTTIMTRHVSGLDWGQSDFTAATIVRATWALVLAIRADSNEALFGVTVTGRQAAVPGIEHMAGPAIATVPLRVKVDWKSNAYQLLQAVHRQIADMIPFEQTGLQNIRRYSEDSAIACQFRSLLVIHNNTPDDTQLSGRPFIEELPHSSIGPRPCDGRYAIDIDCRLVHDGVYARLEFDTRIFPKPELACVVEDFESILRFLADNVNGQGRLADTVASVSSFTSRRLADVLQWNSQVPDPAPQCVHVLVEKKALECPNSLAIHAWDGSLEYQHLLEISTNFALQLIQAGVTGTIVPLLFEKSLWMPVAALAVVKAGGVLVAMDMKQPYERLAQIVSQTNSPVLVCSEQNSSLAQRFGRQQFIVGWNRHHLDVRCQSKDPELPVIHPENLLYIVFTSGSTGTPKGVRITHQNLCTAISHQREALGYNDKSRVIDFASYAFDVTWSNIFFSFAAGACLCIPSSQERENHLADSLRKYGINLMDSTPSLARALGKDVLSSLTTLIIGGEMILPSDALLAGDHTRIINAYSPAECTPTALISPLDATGVRIGRGFGVVTWIVEEDNPQQLASVGTVGELWLEGPLVGAGYIDDAEKTAAAFIQDPAWLVQKTGRRGRVYRTGDLVRYEPDGNIVFVGRKDDQVKIRGQRVELGEIESVIRRAIQQPTLQIVVEAVQQASGTGNLTLVAFLALQGSQEMDEDSHNTEVQRVTEVLASRLPQLLPSYMVPTMYFPLREIPMVTNDKTDRKRLRAMGKTLLSQAKSSAVGDKEMGNDDEEPLDGMQVILQNTWMSVLNLSREEASIDATFARLGGDSISAMQIVSQCRMHNIHLTVSDILLSRTIRNLAKVCRDVSSQENPSTPKLEEDSTALFDLSPIQRNFFATYPDGLNHYNQFFLLDLKNPVSRTSLEAAIQAIVLRHDMLRARFEKDLNTHTWKQRTAEYSTETFALAEHTMKDHAAVGLESQRRQENMDIRNGPVFACDLFNLPTGNQMLLLSAHHLVIDLVSWRIIWADLEDHLQSRNLHSPQTLSFQAWCTYQARIGRTLSPLLVLPYSIPEPQIGFWGVSPEENTYGQCKAVEVSFSSDVSSLLFGKSNDPLGTEGIDLILSALFHAFIHTFPERSTPAIWIEGHGREQFSEQPVDVSSTVGWFTSMYPFAIPINLHHSLARDVIRLVKDTRRKVPANGQQFWACRYNSESGRLAFEGYDNPEIVLNFTGRFQQLEKEDGLFNPSSSSESSDSLLAITEVSKSARRQSMIDIEATVSDGELKVEFIFHKMMQNDRLGTRVDMGVPVKDVLRATSKKSEENMAIQHVFIGEVLHRLGLLGQQLFNTSLSIRSYDKEEIHKYSIKFQTLDDEDGHEYDLSLNVSLNRHGHTDLLLEYRKPYITQQIAEEVYETLNQAIDYLLTIDIDRSTGDDDLQGEVTIINKDQSANSISLFDQVFLQKYGVERSIANNFWKDQFYNTHGTHFPEVKQMVTATVEGGEKIHQTLKIIDFIPGSFPADVVVRAAWAILTAHFSNSDESLFGVCRLNDEGRKSILPTRIVLNWSNTITQFLSEIEQQIRSMDPFQSMRLEQISCLSDEAEFACNFQTLLVIGPPRAERIECYENPLITNGDTKGGVFKGDNHAIVMKVSEGESHDVEIAISFESRIVSMDRAIGLAHGLEHTIRQLLDINRREDKLWSVTVASHRDLNNIWAWNAELPAPVEGVIPDLIVERVIQQPHFPAVNAWDGDLTYGELHELSSKLAHHLLAEGVGRGSIVPLCFEKSKWMPVAALAVMKTGAAAVAINTSFPEQRLRSIIGQVFTSSTSRLILSSVSNKHFFGDLGEGVVYEVGDNLHLPIGSTSVTPEWPDVHPSDAFYIVFTSGTTGDAKGVVITHENFISAIAYQGEFLGFGGNPRVLDFTSYAFDVAWLNLLRALATGGCLCIPSQEEFENNLGGCLEKYQATVADLTPSVARIIEPRSAFSRLSTLILGGEAILPSDLDLAGDETQLVLAYGPAECTPTSTILYAPKCLEGGEIGRGVGVCTWVVDLRNPDALAAVGAVGELWIEGPLVGEGYLNDPGKTAEAFVKDPIWLQRGSPDERHPGRRGRLYRTGDLVQYQEDGSLLFLSRRDTQVKIRGQRVELGELEHHIGSMAVKVMQDAGALGENVNVQVVAELVELSGITDKTLAAFIAVDGISSSNSSPEHNEEANEQAYNRLVQQMIKSVRKQIEEVLPRYMLPSTYIPVKRIPITATGKADRRELRRMAASLSTREIEALGEASVDERAPPQTEKECAMQGLWAEVLKIEDRDRISASDSFFRLGGDSIAAMKIVALGRQRGLEFTVRDVFQHPVLRELCIQCHDLTKEREKMPLEEEQGGSHPQHLEPSELGTKEYWERYYDSSLTHFLSSKRDGRRRRDEQQGDGEDDDQGEEDDDSDIGTSWFSEHNAPQKVLDFMTSEKFPLAPDYSQSGREPSILDLGTGNGSMLTLLREEGGFSGPMVGVDYSVKSIELARRLAGQGEGDEGIRFEVWDILDPRHEEDIRSGVFGKKVDWFPFEQGGFDIVLDKGTFDAVSLSAEGGSKRICEKYPGVALGLVRKGGFLIITSCNWTESELVSWFTAGDHGDGDCFTVYDRVEYPKFRFGGQEGQGVCTICFQRSR